jgi:hypothetical protein
MTPQSDFLVMGLPGAGKTTFLAAFWNAVEYGQGEGTLQLGEIGEHEQAHLNRVRDQWIKCAELAKTSIADEQSTVIPIRSTGGRSIPLVFPDLSGESFQNQWQVRNCSDNYRNLAVRCKGCLLFINPDKVHEPVTIAEVHDADPDSAEGQDPATVWEPEIAPTQVVLVDLLQNLRYLRAASASMKIAILVSAWDEVKSQKLDPQAWLTKRLPLLSQYLTANSSYFSLRVYGVSAQGGPLSERERLLAFDIPSNRVEVQFGSTISNDITAPVRWLMERA